jgi:hypothetical protein
MISRSAQQATPQAGPAASDEVAIKITEHVIMTPDSPDSVAAVEDGDHIDASPHAPSQALPGIPRLEIVSGRPDSQPARPHNVEVDNSLSSTRNPSGALRHDAARLENYITTSSSARRRQTQPASDCRTNDSSESPSPDLLQQSFPLISAYASGSRNTKVKTHK